MPGALRSLLIAAALVLCVPAAASAATLVGTTTLYANHDSNSAGTAEAFSTTATASGSVGSLSVYIDASSTASKVVIGLYANVTGSHPGALLTQGTITSP